MRKFLASALAAVTFGGAVAAAASPAAADSYRYHRHHRGGHGDAAAAAVVAGIAGLAIGAALSDGDRDRYPSRYYRSYSYAPRYGSYDGYDGYDSYGRYGGYYDYRPRYRTCTTRERVWDPYIGRRVTIEREYRC